MLPFESLRRGLPRDRTQAYQDEALYAQDGKAERFIQTALREWAYAVAYPTSDHRAAELPTWLQPYNWHRPHGSLKSKRQSVASAKPWTTC